MDAGLVVGYLVAFLSGKAKKLADKAVDELLERLYGKVASKLRADPAMRELEDDASNDAAQAAVARSLNAVVASNDQLASELQQLVKDLDQRGAQQLIVGAPVHGHIFQNVTAQQGSIVGSIGRDVHIYQDSGSAEISALRNAGCATKTSMILGVLLALAGMGLGIFSVFTWNPQFGSSDFGQFPPGAMLGFGLFFAGFVLIAITKMIVTLRRR